MHVLLFSPSDYAGISPVAVSQRVGRVWHSSAPLHLGTAGSRSGTAAVDDGLLTYRTPGQIYWCVLFIFTYIYSHTTLILCADFPCQSSLRSLVLFCCGFGFDFIINCLFSSSSSTLHWTVMAASGPPVCPCWVLLAEVCYPGVPAGQLLDHLAPSPHWCSTQALLLFGCCCFGWWLPCYWGAIVVHGQSCTVQLWISRTMRWSSCSSDDSKCGWDSAEPRRYMSCFSSTIKVL